MNNSQLAEFGCKLAREEGEKRYVYGQATFNYQFKLLVSIAKKGYMQERHLWRFK